MHSLKRLLGVFPGLLALATWPLHAQTTNITYQGRLFDNGGLPNGNYDLRFVLKDAASGGSTVGAPLTNAPVTVSNGLFTVTLGFSAGAFAGADRWLEIGVRTNGSAAPHIVLAPRQQITSAPYALTAGTVINPTFLGTTASTPLEFYVNNTRALRLEPTTIDASHSNTVNVVGGSPVNYVGASTRGATISGGGGVPQFGGGSYTNSVQSFTDFATIGGGGGNNIMGNAYFATIAGGELNNIGTSADHSTIGGGAQNSIQASSMQATIGGGYQNTITSGGSYAMIPGGKFNLAAGLSFAAGNQAKAVNTGTFVWADSTAADFTSTANNQFLVRASGGVGIGTNNPAGAMLNVAGTVRAPSFTGSFTGNGSGLASVNAATVGGLSSASLWTLGGNIGASPTNGAFIGTSDDQPLEFRVNGSRALRLEPTINDAPNIIGGSSINSIASGVEGATIGGGYNNTIQIGSTYSIIGGGVGNLIQTNSFASTIAGGDDNIIEGSVSTQGRSTIGGGAMNHIQTNASFSTIAGGYINKIGTNSSGSSIGGGSQNTIFSNAALATISGGVNNVVQNNSDFSAISGGSANTIAGPFGVVPGGDRNVAGTNAFAAGRRAKANHTGAFVWADSADADFASTNVNQFSVRAGGGVRLETAGAGLTLDGNPVFVGPVLTGSGLAGTYPNTVAFNNPTNVFFGTFAGNGGGLTNLSAAQLTSDLVPEARLSGNIARLNGIQTFAGTNNFNHPSNTFTGIGSGLTALNASQLATGLVPEAQLSPNVARVTGSQIFTGTNAFTHPSNTFAGRFSGDAGGLTNVALAAASFSSPLPDAALTTNIARLVVPNTTVQATATPVFFGDLIFGATNLNGGRGYFTPPVVTVNDSTGTGAAFTAQVSGGVVTGLTRTSTGSGYSANTTITIAPPPGNDYQVFASTNYFSGINYLTNASNIIAGKFTGDGAGLVNLNAANLVGSIPAGNIAAGAISSTQLASGAAAANLAASGQSGVPSGGLVLSATENAALASAGFVRIGSTTLNDAWLQRSTNSAPSARAEHRAVWTGTEMIVWGGYNGSVRLNDGARYNPTSNAWTAITSVGAPTARQSHSVVWTGSEMIIWGGATGPGAYLNDGARYNPTSNTWTAISSAGAPSARSGHIAIWTGSEMIIWGGQVSGGARYNPSNNTWTAMQSSGEPVARSQFTEVWTGTEMIVWGGTDGSSALNTGGRYNPTANTWTATQTSGAPSARNQHFGVWTGSEMIIWGGASWTDGARYNPVSNSWTPMTNTGAPGARGDDVDVAIWTGSEMVIWGGQNSSGDGVNDGGRYNPVANSWSATTLTGAPSTRWRRTTVWTGSEMIIFGGYANSSSVLGDIYSYTPGKVMFLYQKP
ncbi:MAG: hypothetical protein HZA89_12355 [Verrucomicrobia bacterium]|nr:hypothetical protein [Verrucomicrobiota bacterium]